MRKAACLAIIFLLAFTQTARAHPPSDIKLSYDKDAKSIKASISHTATNPESHYVNKVEVLINGKVVLTHELSRQEGDSGQFLSYTIPDAKPGDIIRVIAYCNSFGKLMKELKIR